MSEINVKIGDVFYRVEPTDFKHYTRKCRVCEGKRELTVNGITFQCPMCGKEQETLRVHGFFVRRYRVYSIEHYINNSDWKYDGDEPAVRYGLYHKSGKGHFSYNNTHRTITVGVSDFSPKVGWFNCPDPSKHSVDRCLYSDYRLAVQVANKLTKEQVEIVRKYNEDNNTDYPLPMFLIEHDKKSN